MNFFKAKTVLLIDDCQMILNATRSMFIKNGCSNDNIYLAKDAKTALSACAIRSYDFIICDYNLGRGSDGLQLIEQMHSKHLIREQTVLFVVTGEMSKSVFYGFAEYEPDGYLIKPINIGAITSRLINCYRQKNIIHNIKKSYRLNGAKAALALCDKYDEVTTISFVRADIHLGEGRSDLAQKIYVKLIQNQVNEARIKLGYLLIAQKKFELAVKLVDAVIDDKKLRFDALQIQALCYLQQGQVRKSAESFNEISAISPNNVGRLLIQYNLSLQLNDIDTSLSFANKINARIKNSIWHSVDHCLIGARCLLLKAEREVERHNRNTILLEFKSQLKGIEKKFRLSQYHWHRELIICRYLLLIGDIKAAKEIWLAYKKEEQIADFYLQLDALFIAALLSENHAINVPVLAQMPLEISQKLLINTLQKNEMKKKANIAVLKKIALQSSLQKDPMQTINQWLDVWQAQPFEFDTALAVIKGFSAAIPMNIPMAELKTTYQQAFETIESNEKNSLVPSWFNAKNTEVKVAFKTLEQHA
jgi:DNA-binding response OmpR family regulator